MKKFLVPLSVSVSLLLVSCAQKAVVKDTVENPPVQQEKKEEAVKSTVEKTIYTVKKGDTLWGISGKKYSDNFQWPLIYKANRDRIENPHVIEIGWGLEIKKDFSKEEIEKAVENAKNMPPYRRNEKKFNLKY